MIDRIFKHKTFSFAYTAVLFLAACGVVVAEWEVNGAILFAYVASAALILSSRLTDAMLPAMLLSVFVTKCYDSADLFLGKLPFIIPVVAAIVLHFVIYRRQYLERFHIGPSFWGLCAVAAAVTLGGLGTISASDYFRGGSLFYVFGLGVGMMLFYLIVKSNFTEESAGEVAKIMYMTGLLACFCVLHFYYRQWETVIKVSGPVGFQSNNNLSTFLMLAMPIPMFYASKRYVDIFSVVFMYACILLSGSRGGLLMGTVEFFLLLLIFTWRKSTPTGLRVICGGLTVGSLCLLFVGLPKLFDLLKIPYQETLGDWRGMFDTLKGYLVQSGEKRDRLITRMKGDFRTNPIFGVGIGYTGNTDIYNPVRGAMTWYHMWFAQVIGGLGLVGILAYGYQLVHRAVIFFCHRNLTHLVFFLSYIGLFLMSQVNPGEFCPIPYAALAMSYFAMMEELPKPKKKSLWQSLFDI